MILRIKNTQRGYALLAILALIIALAIAAGVAVESLGPSLETARKARTERALDGVAKAIAGDYALGGSMTGADFGYVGDIGAFPASLADLVSAPMGFTTWDGPYLTDEFLEATGISSQDSWGVALGYAGAVTINSTGSGQAISQSIAASSSDLLNCGISGKVVGANNAAPGASSGNLVALMDIPDGAGGTSTLTSGVDAGGGFSFTGIPIGLHPVYAIDTVAADSAISVVRILPRSTTSVNLGSLRLNNVTY